MPLHPYFSCDYYPLIDNATDNTSWCGWQYDRPEENDGIVLLFRRCESPTTEAVLKLTLPRDDRKWIFEDADTGEHFCVTGKEAAQGIPFRIETVRTSRLLRYHLAGENC